MSHCTDSVPAGTWPRLGSFLNEAGRACVDLARGVDAWLAARKRAAADRDAFLRMSDRELHDIGVDRGSIEGAMQRAWQHPN